MEHNYNMEHYNFQGMMSFQAAFFPEHQGVDSPNDSKSSP